MGLNFSIKKKETIILLVIVIGILALIGWFYLDTLRLTPQAPPKPQKVENKDSGGTGRVVRKKIETPQVEKATTTSSTVPTAAPDGAAGEEDKPLTDAPDQPDEPSATPPEDQPITKADDTGATDGPSSDATPSDAPEEPSDADSEETAQSDEQTPETESADAPAVDKSDDGQVADASATATADETDVDKPPESTESTSSDLRMREPGRPYSIKLASIRRKAHAQHGLKEFKKDNTDPFIARLDLGAERGIWWNIYTGHFETKEEALEVWKTLDRPDSHIKKLAYANFIGEFDSQAETASVYQRLEEKGYRPYVIREGDKWRLYVGDFLYKEGAAERNQKRLQADGFSSEIVER